MGWNWLVLEVQVSKSRNHVTSAPVVAVEAGGVHHIKKAPPLFVLSVGSAQTFDSEKVGYSLYIEGIENFRGRMKQRERREVTRPKRMNKVGEERRSLNPNRVRHPSEWLGWGSLSSLLRRVIHPWAREMTASIRRQDIEIGHYLYIVASPW